jgi:hypothetical protein
VFSAASLEGLSVSSVPVISPVGEARSEAADDAAAAAFHPSISDRAASLCYAWGEVNTSLLLRPHAGPWRLYDDASDQLTWGMNPPASKAERAVDGQASILSGLCFMLTRSSNASKVQGP